MGSVDFVTRYFIFITRAVRRHELIKVSVALSNSFFYFWGRDGLRDKTSGHELLFSVSFFCTRGHEFSVALSNSLNSRSRSLYSSSQRGMRGRRARHEQDRGRHASHEQPQHKLLTVKLAGELFKLT